MLDYMPDWFNTCTFAFHFEAGPPLLGPALYIASCLMCVAAVQSKRAQDWVLGLLYRSKSVTALINKIAGLCPVEGVRGIENVGLGRLIGGHAEYMDNMGEILEMLVLDGI